MTDGCDISSEIAFRSTSWDLSDDKSTLVQVMAWCRQATSHYLNQCWPRSLLLYMSLCMDGWFWFLTLNQFARRVTVIAYISVSVCPSLYPFPSPFLTYCPMRNATDFKLVIFKCTSSAFLVKLPSSECIKTSLMINMASGNGLVPSGNKPLPESMLTQIYGTIWYH